MPGSLMKERHFTTTPLLTGMWGHWQTWCHRSVHSWSRRVDSHQETQSGVRKTTQGVMVLWKKIIVVKKISWNSFPWHVGTVAVSGVSYLFPVFLVDLQDQRQRAMMLEQERRRAEDEAARLEAERQAALLAKEELARHAEDQQKSQDQLVGISYRRVQFFWDYQPGCKYSLGIRWACCSVLFVC